jgi:hypothetical protein
MRVWGTGILDCVDRLIPCRQRATLAADGVVAQM